MPDVDIQHKKTLLKAQRAWIAFRDAEAEYAVDEIGCRQGTMSVLIHVAALQRLTDERTSSLKKIAKFIRELEK